MTQHAAKTYTLTFLTTSVWWTEADAPDKAKVIITSDDVKHWLALGQQVADQGLHCIEALDNRCEFVDGDHAPVDSESFMAGYQRVVVEDTTVYFIGEVKNSESETWTTDELPLAMLAADFGLDVPSLPYKAVSGNPQRVEMLYTFREEPDEFSANTPSRVRATVTAEEVNQWMAQGRMIQRAGLSAIEKEDNRCEFYCFDDKRLDKAVYSPDEMRVRVTAEGVQFTGDVSTPNNEPWRTSLLTFAQLAALFEYADATPLAS